jgi:hypothetical protein
LLPFFPFRGACRIAGVDLADTSRFCSSQTHRDETRRIAANIAKLPELLPAVLTFCPSGAR